MEVLSSGGGVAAAGRRSKGRERIAAALALTLVALLVLVTATSASIKLSHGGAAVGFDPVATASADFNHDGRMDLAVSNFAASANPAAKRSITILAGQKNGSFKPVKTLDSDQPTGIVADNFGKGGDPDLLVATFTGNVELYKGGKGFKFGAPKLTPVGNDARGIVAEDFDGDHRRDFAVTIQQPAALKIYFAKNGGTSFGSEHVIAGASDGRPVISTRLNGDNRPDLVTANGLTGKLTVLLGKRKGKFAKQTYKVKGATIPAAFDFDQDKNTDIAVASETQLLRGGAKGGSGAKSSLVVLSGSKKGKLHKVSTTKLKPFGKLRPTALTAAQIDGDHDADLVLGVQKAGATKRGDGGPAAVQVWTGQHKAAFAKTKTFSVAGLVGQMTALRRGAQDVVAVPIDPNNDTHGVVRLLSGR
jgi:hypothetical protein